MEKEYKSFVFYQTFYESICAVPDEDAQLRLYKAVVEYGLYGKEPELPGWDNAVFIQIRKLLADNHIKRENGKKGAEHGKKGGRPPSNPQEKTPHKPQENPTQTPNVNDNEINDNVLLLNKNINTTTTCANAREITVEEFEREVQCEGWERYPTGEVYAEVRNTLIELINDGTIALWEVNHELIGSMLNSMFQGRNRREITDLKAYLLAIIKRNNKSINGE